MQKPRFPLWHIATPSYRQRFSPCFRRVKLVCMGFLIHCCRVWLKGLGQLVWDWFICGRWPKENLRHWQNKWMLRNDRGVDISWLQWTYHDFSESYQWSQVLQRYPVFFLAWSGMVSLKNLHEERPDLLYIGLIWQGPETELLLPTTELQKFWTHESHETRCASTNLINPCCSDHQNPYLLGLLVFDLSSTLRYLVGRFCEGNDW